MEEDLIYPLKVSKEKKEMHVDLLLTSNDDTTHYCYIKNFHRLAGSSKDKNRRFCLHGYSRKTTLNGKIKYQTDEEMTKKLEEHEKTAMHSLLSI